MLSVPKKIGSTVRSVANFARKHSGMIKSVAGMMGVGGGMLAASREEDNPFKDEPHHQVVHKDYSFCLH
jgi:hypothetical protein